jgi:hypothetical protein
VLGAALAQLGPRLDELGVRDALGQAGGVPATLLEVRDQLAGAALPAQRLLQIAGGGAVLGLGLHPLGACVALARLGLMCTKRFVARAGAQTRSGS